MNASILTEINSSVLFVYIYLETFGINLLFVFPCCTYGSSVMQSAFNDTLLPLDSMHKWPKKLFSKRKYFIQILYRSSHLIKLYLRSKSPTTEPSSPQRYVM